MARDSGKQVLPELKCTVCGLILHSARSLREHVAQHKWGPHRQIVEDGCVKFQCLFRNCGKLLRDRKVLRKHCLTHRPREFECPECGKRFYERTKLKRHNLVHTGEKEFVCSFEGCQKRFAYKANLRTHLRTHTGHRPFQCTWQGCTKSFAQASNRNAHVLTHRCGDSRDSKRKRVDSIEINLQTPPISPGKVKKFNMPKEEFRLGSSPMHLSSPLSQGQSSSLTDLSISPANRDTISSLLSLRYQPHTSEQVRKQGQVSNVEKTSAYNNLSLGVLAGVLSTHVHNQSFNKFSSFFGHVNINPVSRMELGSSASPAWCPSNSSQLPYFSVQHTKSSDQVFLKSMPKVSDTLRYLS